MATAPKVRRIIVLGARSVGKSSLTIQFAEGRFVDSYYPTIENTVNKTIRYRGQEFAAEIMDTAGQDEYSILNSRHAIGIHGYILVYSITSRASFEMVHIIREKILDYTGTENVPTVLVGNKTDLDGQRQVSVEEGQELAASWGCQFIEASAKNNENINQLFELMIAEVERHNSPPTNQDVSTFRRPVDIFSPATWWGGAHGGQIYNCTVIREGSDGNKNV
ncbi:ferrous iron transporter B [Endogone sp. FLAS-F59071]|nr:ferrous iron transporter B [Endogone sp. FLAS-F59071]|eukprot:RUS18832.1 ferrous iron transporter B [Endogone sp. FLAS-F59071]